MDFTSIIESNSDGPTPRPVVLRKLGLPEICFPFWFKHACQVRITLRAPIRHSGAAILVVTVQYRFAAVSSAIITVNLTHSLHSQRIVHPI